MQNSIDSIKRIPHHWLVIALLFTYFVSRLINLLAIPVFMDESMHIAYGLDYLNQVVPFDAYTSAFNAGKLLTGYLLAPFVLLPFDPLLTGRIACVIAGGITLWAIVATGNRLFSPQIGLWAGIIYTVSPFVFFYNRMVLADNFQMMFVALILYFTVENVLAPPSFLKRIALLALLIGVVLSKLNGLSSIVLPVFAGLLLAPKRQRFGFTLKLSITSLSALIVVASLILIGYGGLALSVSSQVDFLPTTIERGTTILEAFWVFLTPPFAVVTVICLVLAIMSRDRKIYWLITSIGLLVVPHIVAGADAYSRYYVAAVVPISLLIAKVVYDRTHEWRLYPKIALAAALSVFPLWSIGTMMIDPPNAYLPAEARFQYITGWPSGYGFFELLDHLERSAQEGNLLTVFRRPYWGNWHEGMDIFLNPPASLTIVDMPHELPFSPPFSAPGERQWVVIDTGMGDQNNPVHQSLIAGGERIWVYERPGGTSSLELWQRVASLAVNNANEG